MSLLHLDLSEQSGKLMLRICIPFILLWSSGISAKTITWIYIDFAPYYILEGAKKGLGRDERVISLLKRVMPTYKFEFVTLPASRAIHELSSPNNAYCMVSLFKTAKRAKHISYTLESSTIGLSPSIAVRRHTLKRLGLEPGQQVSIRDLMSRHQLMLGVSANRSFGTTLDNIINSVSSDLLVSRPGKDPLIGLTGMLLKNRVDLVLGYPSEHYHLKQLLDDNYRLTQLTIKETQGISRGYVGCTKTPKTKLAIADLNIALKAIKSQRRFSDTMLYWLPTELQPTLTSKLTHIDLTAPEG
ncbi:hypothetical protein PSECIP111951_01808 [Pseudoalteromonas holothuriae]|uniref:Solute-binding protein family 3/N-terminal domain-containing protein n=1 Tax=Pseudoalteromonas holothuriae TaxID=2963714 RepID=A0A9W4VR28_9GAMM|nr:MULTISPECIES: hypothetical protein [unclassified Pseudoalteromonas]CAH9058131.1 hypothetical protein PSECIP111951_01808 [Pseudoalteromonas sp. CIP111951]CAH9058552.1 hypothetical protein PSECIP111854_02226 [Pseudoalteromonas sp. CIP111854]